jgi:hypothetical protein
VISDSKQSFSHGCFATVQPCYPLAVIQCARPPRKFAAGTPCNTVPLIRCSRVSGSLGGKIADVIASAYLSAASGAVEASFWKRGSFRSGLNIGSSWSSAGVSGPSASFVDR